jgi:hypothetical protein
MLLEDILVIDAATLDYYRAGSRRATRRAELGPGGWDASEVERGKNARNITRTFS